MSEKAEYIGCVKFSGNLVQDGLFDARKSAQALLGFDEAVRFFVEYQVPEIRMSEFELPVRIRQGSWEALIPSTIGKWLETGLGIVTAAYLVKAAQKMAENDFDNIGFKAVFKKALEGIQWFIRIAKHYGDITKRTFTNLKFRNDNNEIGLLNSDGECLYAPRLYLEMYIASNPNMLVKLAELVEDERILSIGVYEGEELIEEKITRKYKYVFTYDEDETVGMLFPELHHGMPVVLEGEVTRGNETTNSIGVRYQDHILTGYPQEGSIVRFKPCLFIQCRVHGFISRKDNEGRIAAKKPKIIIDRIEPLVIDTKNKLF